MGIGKLDDQNILKNNIIINFDTDSEYIKNLESIIMNGKIPDYISLMKQESQKKVLPLKNPQNQIYGHAFLLDNFNKKEQKAINENNNNNNDKKDKLSINDYINTMINYYVFNKNLINDIESTKQTGCSEKIKYYKTSKYYLISSKFMDSFKKYFYADKLFSIIHNYEKNLSINNDPIINKINEDLINLNFYKKLEENINANLQIDENLFDIENEAINNNIMSPKNFEIINDGFYKYFIERNNIGHKNKIIELEIIINNGKINLAFINKEIILIGHLDYKNYLNYKFISDVLLYCYDMKSKNTMVASLKILNYINAINNENLIKNIFIHYFDESLRQKKSEDNINIIEQGKKILKLFILLYLHYEELNENINMETLTDSNEIYYLINGQFLRKYKEHYNYEKFRNIIETDEKIKQGLPSFKKQILYCQKSKINYEGYMNSFIQNFKEDFINELGQKRENQNDLITNLKNESDVKYKQKQTESGKLLLYYEEDEIINSESVALFIKSESTQIISLVKKEEIKNILFGEKKVFINYEWNNYFVSNVGHLINNIFVCDLLIYFYKKDVFKKEFLSKIKSDSFDKYIHPYLKDFKDKNISHIINNKYEKLGNIIKIKDLTDDFYNLKVTQIIKPEEIKAQELNDNAKKILKLIIYNEQFINRIKFQIKEGENNIGYLIKNDFMFKIQQLNIYQFIKKYITITNQNIQQLLKANQDEEYTTLYQKVLNEFDNDIINYINKYNIEINIYSNEYEANFQNIKLNTSNWTYIVNHFNILNEEIYNLFINKYKHPKKESFIYFYQKNKIFVLSDKFQYRNTTLSMYKINQKNELELEMLFNFFDENSRDECIKLIKKIGYDKYQGYLLFDENDLSSPIFDTNQKQIGNAYKYKESIKDYTDYNVTFEIRKIFLLYMNYQNLVKNPDVNGKTFKGYYIVNKKWIQEYKKYYNYDILSAAIDKNSVIQNVFKNNNFNFNDKLLTLMIKLLPKNLVDDFNYKDKNISQFNNKEKKRPEMSEIMYGSDKNLLYYYDFELINSDLYDYLFKSNKQNLKAQNFNNINSEDKAEKVECIIDQKYLLIQFPNPTLDNKYMLQIGKLNSEKVFEPEFFLLYDQFNYLCEHVNNVLNSAGFTEYCDTFNSLPLNTLDIIGNSEIKYGIAIKKNINSNYNNNIFQEQNLISNQFIKYVKYLFWVIIFIN